MSAFTGDGLAGIFVSYRRQETDYPAAWLFSLLASHFGRDQIFKDVDSIEPGDNFVEVITTAVESCDVLLALIGRSWLTITDEDGRRRLDSPKDFVRLEIEAALARNVRVIPILVDGARMPRADELPESLAKLADRQAVELSPNQFDAGIRPLFRVLDRMIRERSPLPSDSGASSTSSLSQEKDGTQIETIAALAFEEQAARLQRLALDMMKVPQSEVDLAQDLIADPNAGIVKLVSNGQALESAGIRGGGAYYDFVRRDQKYGYGSDVALQDGSLRTGFAGANYGFILWLGQFHFKICSLIPPMNSLLPFIPVSMRLGDSCGSMGLRVKSRRSASIKAVLARRQLETFPYRKKALSRRAPHIYCDHCRSMTTTSWSLCMSGGYFLIEA